MSTKSQTPYQIIIGGFHRSGTSLTTQYLHHAGLELGGTLMGANPSNPDGHFEDRDIVELHKRMLAANHRDWYTPGPGLSDNVQGFDEQARDILQKFPADRSMGFKDPRSSLFLSWWHRLLDRPAAVFVFRHYAACYHSLRSRQAQNLTFHPERHADALFFWQQPELALRLWLDYNRAIIDYVKRHRETTLLVSHGSLLNGLNLPQLLNRKLGMTLDENCNSGIRLSDSSIPGIAEPIDLALQSELDATLATLNELSSTEAEPESQPAQSQPHRNEPNPEALLPTLQNMEILCDGLRIKKVADTLDSVQTESADKVGAENASDTGLADHSDDVKQLLHWGKQHKNAGHPSDAEACFIKAQQLAPRNKSALLHLALLARDGRQYRKSESYLQSLIDLVPDNVSYILYLARVQNELGDPQNALATVQRGLSRQPAHEALNLLLVELLQAEGRYQDAKEACMKALAASPEQEKLIKAMVQLAARTEDSASAMNWFRRSVVMRMRQQQDYRLSLRHAINRVRENQQMPLLQQICTELESLKASVSCDETAASDITRQKV